MNTFIRNTISFLDVFSWLLVFVFFGGSALLFGGDLFLASFGAFGIIVVMFIIAVSIEIIIESLKNTKGIGTLTGFITNGPEAVCLVVGLAVGDIIFAASTPLGSNFMNPFLLALAALLCGKFLATVSSHKLYTMVTILSSAALAGSFFLLKPAVYPIWLLVTVAVSIPLFLYRPKENHEENKEDHSFSPVLWLPPAVISLTAAGYYLDPVVSFSAEYSKAPKGVIGFLILSALTSWPEFKSCMVLLKRNHILAAILNITVSNITNLWLAAIGIATYIITP